MSVGLGSTEEELMASVSAIAQIAAVPAILDVICRFTGMGLAAVARVTDERWICCAAKDDTGRGMGPGSELEVEHTLCNTLRYRLVPLAIDDVRKDPNFRDHVGLNLHGIRSYISMPIVLPDGRFFGSLCAVDPRPLNPSRPEVVAMFRLFADLIAFHLDTSQKLAASQADLDSAREAAMLREQFIAVLGHDLRNPLAAIQSSVEMLARTAEPGRERSSVGIIEKSVARMASLIDNMLDLTRARLGDGLSLSIDAEKPLAPVLEHVVDELRSAWPHRTIETAFDLTLPVAVDQGRLSQVLSNLVANALMHGAADRPVRVYASTELGEFMLTVVNEGAPIPEAVLTRLFQPFFRASAKPSQQGLGLGLYIASEIAKAHGGTLTVTSSEEETRFVFRLALG